MYKRQDKESVVLCLEKGETAEIDVDFPDIFVLPEFRLENSTPMEDESYPEIVAIFLTPLISNHPCKTISLCNYAFSLIITFLLSLHRHFSFILLVFQGHFCSFAQKFLIIQQLFILYSHITVTINS